jgi:hypothetical protein
MCRLTWIKFSARFARASTLSNASNGIEVLAQAVRRNLRLNETNCDALRQRFSEAI